MRWVMHFLIYLVEGVILFPFAMFVIWGTDAAGILAWAEFPPPTTRQMIVLAAAAVFFARV